MLWLLLLLGTGCLGENSTIQSVTIQGQFATSSLLPQQPNNATHEWTYEEKDEWPEEFKDCHGTHQSPIAIDTGSAITNHTFAPLKFNDGYKRPPNNGSIINNGHTAQISISDNANMWGGPLRGAYEFAQLHFHWGGNDTLGSEHTVDGHRYPLELHLVHFRKNLVSIKDALGKKDGVVVFAVWFDTPSNSSSGYNPKRGHNKILVPLVKSLRRIPFAGNTTSVDGMVGIRSFLPEDVSSYFHYEGSLTTPTCTENVLWIVFRNTQTISHDQLTAFRRLWEEKAGTPLVHHLENNFRKTQPLNGRKVYMVGSPAPKACAGGALTFLLLLVVGAAGLPSHGLVSTPRVRRRRRTPFPA